MRVRDHVMISAVSAGLGVPVVGWSALGLLAGGVLIDADHYAWYCLTQRRLSPVAAVRFFGQADPPAHQATRVLHSPWVLLATSLATRRWRSLAPVAAGMCLHVALDGLYESRMARARSAALIRDAFRCQGCGARTPDVRAHVWRQPTLLPSFAVACLESLCRTCHNAAHGRERGRARWR